MSEEDYKEIYLTKEESARWISFHETAYKEDKNMAEIIMDKSPRWSVIMSYYAMHDITKLYLAKNHNLKVQGDNVHAQTIFLISKYVQQEKNKIIPLLEKAKKEFESIVSASIWAIPQLLRKGRDERTKVQYYSDSRAEKNNMEMLQAAQYFYDNFAVPYIKIMGEMI